MRGVGGWSLEGSSVLELLLEVLPDFAKLFPPRVKLFFGKLIHGTRVTEKVAFSSLSAMTGAWDTFNECTRTGTWLETFVMIASTRSVPNFALRPTG